MAGRQCLRQNGEIGFVPSAVPLATKVGAARPYYKPRQVATLAHARGVYLIGRVVMFEDPRLSEGRPDLAAHNPDPTSKQAIVSSGMRTSGSRKMDMLAESRSALRGCCGLLHPWD